jgi:glutathione-regulated potassium-efflux system ancillary protein KefG
MKTQNRVLVLFAHPALQKSRVNRVMIEQVRTIRGIEFHDLYEAYPEFDIDVSHEQSLMEANDVIVFQHPFFWYSTPAIIKEWLDLVLEHDWAYGSKGNALHGKYVMHAVTTGGRESAYGAQGLNRYSMRQFLRPLEQTACLCGMHFLPPFIVHGTHQLTPAAIAQHAADYLQVIKALRDGRFDLAAVSDYPQINANLSETLNLTKGEQHAR